MNKAALLAFAALGVGLAVMAGSSPPKPEEPPPRKGETVPPPEPPPLTLSPKGRYLTPFERLVMGRYFKPEVLNATKLWFGRPASSFAIEENVETGTGAVTEALATKNGVYFRFENHELQTPYELALLAHEMVHVDQFMRGPIAQEEKAGNEVRAYQMQIAVKQDMDNVLEALRDEWQGVRYA